MSKRGLIFDAKARGVGALSKLEQFAARAPGLLEEIPCAAIR